MPRQKYDFEIDLANRNNCHTLMVELIGSNKRVLEAGCATGYMSRVLSERGCDVVGLEIDPAAAELAKAYVSQIHIGDIESFDLEGEIDGGPFDVVVFGDVLEHLRDPLTTLRRIRPLLRPDGIVVASMPNVAHGAVRLSLLKGRFDYGPLGLLDETHLRFFTRDGIYRLFRDAGFVVAMTERTTVPLFDTEIDLQPDEFDDAVIKDVLDDPESLTYQFVVKAVLDNADRGLEELHAALESLRVDYHQLRQTHERAAAALDEARVMLEELPQKRAEAETLRAALEASQGARVELEHKFELLTQRWNRLDSRLPMRLYRRLQRILRAGR